MRTKVLLIAVLGFASLVGAVASLSSATSTDETLAIRYHLRYRTQQFYQRARPKSHLRLVDSESGVELPTIGAADAEMLAGRYYIRNRTSNFFRRATPKRHWFLS
jgi:hypothetical protein